MAIILILENRRYFLAFLAAVLLAGAFLVAGFLAAGFFVTAFLGAVFVAAGFFLAAAVSFTPADLAVADSLALRRDAVFILSTFFLTALSSMLWALLRLCEVGLALKALAVSFSSRFKAALRARRTPVWRMRLIEDLIMGIATTIPQRGGYVNTGGVL